VSGLLVNIDVENLERATDFYCAPIYLLPKAAGTPASAQSSELRHYGRHWTPVHLDFVVNDLEEALARAARAGATVESEVQTHPYGRIALLADPFGNGFCLLQFTGRGYDEIAN
jgi:predicted enzyme related to lactoylglutathione lyase